MIDANRKKPKVFICYMKQDESKAEELFKYLENAGADPWMDMRSLRLGNQWESRIKKAVAESDAFVVCLRPGFEDIGFRQEEVKWAFDASQLRPSEIGFIIPFIIEPCDLPNWCKKFHAGAHRTEAASIKDLIAAINEHCNANLVLGVREIKYILSKQHYIRLKKYLLKNAEDIKRTDQWNFYYYDEFKVILDQKAMARLRFENLLKQDSSSHFDKILLTFKTKPATCLDGTEIRPESNFDLTEKLTVEFNKNVKFTKKDVKNFVNNIDFGKHLARYFKPFLESLKGEFYHEGIKSVDKLKLNMCCQMKNLRFRAITHNELTLELDKFTTDKGEYYELEIETQEAIEARRDEYIHLLFATLDIPIVCPKEKFGRYPPKVAIMLHDAGIINLEGRLDKGKDSAEKLIKKTHKEMCSSCQALLKI